MPKDPSNLLQTAGRRVQTHTPKSKSLSFWSIRAVMAQSIGGGKDTFQLPSSSLSLSLSCWPWEVNEDRRNLPRNDCSIFLKWNFRFLYIRNYGKRLIFLPILGTCYSVDRWDPEGTPKGPTYRWMFRMPEIHHMRGGGEETYSPLDELKGLPPLPPPPSSSRLREFFCLRNGARSSSIKKFPFPLMSTYLVSLPSSSLMPQTSRVFV